MALFHWDDYELEIISFVLQGEDDCGWMFISPLDKE